LGAKRTRRRLFAIPPENVQEHLSIDEVSLSKGELYTFVTNKSHNGRKGGLVASIKGTKSDDIVAVLNKIPKETRLKVKEITLDMAPNMALACKKCFETAQLTTDRFHVVKLVNEAMQHLRVKLRWKAIEEENEAIKESKKQGKKHQFQEFENGDTAKKQVCYRQETKLLDGEPRKKSPNFI
jgi:transposase